MNVNTLHKNTHRRYWFFIQIYVCVLSKSLNEHNYWFFRVTYIIWIFELKKMNNDFPWIKTLTFIKRKHWLSNTGYTNYYLLYWFQFLFDSKNESNNKPSLRYEPTDFRFCYFICIIPIDSYCSLINFIRSIHVRTLPNP